MISSQEEMSVYTFKYEIFLLGHQSAVTCEEQDEEEEGRAEDDP